MEANQPTGEQKAAVRRNDPCPCGSGRRYKDCHGSLPRDGAGPEALLGRALGAHQQGRVEEAERGYREVLAGDPSNAIATHYLGLIAWQRGDVAAAELGMRASIDANPAIPDFHNNLGLLLRDTRRVDESLACFRRALEVAPAWYEAHNNMGLALEAAGRWDDAIAAYRDGIACEPGFAAAHQNLGRALVTRGDYAEGWAHYRWRLLAQGVTATPPDAASPLPASLPGRRFALLAEQGLGDIVFFLRFAPELVRRGALLAFRGDPRLHAMLGRTGLFALGLDAAGAAAPGEEALYIGELPWLLAANDPARFPAPLALAADPARVARVRQSLEALGRGPCIALTWRGGVASAGPARTQVKEIDLAALGAALRGIDATWISVQRLPREGEREKLAAAIGAPLHDWSAANDDLEEMLALLSVASVYAGVSNANMHLRAGVGGPMEVLVPHPPEWRWGLDGSRSPWFAAATVHRQTPQGDWTSALRALREKLVSGTNFQEIRT